MIKEYIIRFLMKNRSLTISGLGKFAKESTGASIHPVIHEFKPPHAVLVFDEEKDCETTSDFIDLVACDTGMRAQEIHQAIHDFNKHIRNEISQFGKSSVEHLGIFSMSFDHSLMFEADQLLDLHPDSFGLPVFTLPQRSSKPESQPVQLTAEVTEAATVLTAESQNDSELPQKVEVEKVDEKVKDEETKLISSDNEILVNDHEKSVRISGEQPDIQEIAQSNNKTKPEETKRKQGRRRPVLIVLLILIAGGGSALYFTGYWEVLYEKARTIAGGEKIVSSAENENNDIKDIPVQVETTAEITDSTAQTEDLPEEIESAETTEPVKESFVSVNTEMQMKYFIVADCFSNLSLAEKRVKNLQAEGYSSSIAGQTKQGLHIVTYVGYADKDQAEAELEKIRNTVKKEAWLYIKK